MIQNATSPRCQRPCWMAWYPTSACAVMACSTHSRSAEQAVRAPDQDHDHEGIDHEGAHLGNVVFAGDIADAKQQRGQKRSGDRGRSADGHHDQEVDHEFEREIWIEAEDFRAQRAAKAGKPATKSKGEGKYLRYVDAEATRGARII